MTRSVDDVAFLHPVKVGDIVCTIVDHFCKAGIANSPNPGDHSSVRQQIMENINGSRCQGGS